MVSPPDKPPTTRQRIARRLRALGQRAGLYRRTEKPRADGEAPGQPAVLSQQEQQRLAAIARESAPVIWLLGKSGAGKTSVIAALTGAGHDQIGNGYQPCTRTSQLYDFPAETPLIRFLDTRGLDEASYDPSEDLAWHQSQAQLIMVVMRLDDPAQDNVIKALAAARKAYPHWPVVVLHTALHDLYPSGANHPASYPFNGNGEDIANPAIPAPLRNALAYQRKLFRGIKGAPPVFVAVDFTRESDGFAPADYGRQALIDALLATAPEALRLLIQLKLRQQGQAFSSDRAQQLNTRILYWAAAASAVGATPVVGLATVPATQLAMLAQLGKAYGVAWNRKHLSALLGMLGIAIVTTQGSLLALRQLAKLGPWLIPVAAAQDYAATYALGRAACVYLEAERNHSQADVEQVKAVFLSSLKQAFSTRDPAAPGEETSQ